MPNKNNVACTAVLGALLVLPRLAAAAPAAATSADHAKVAPQCKTAIVNPISGYAECVDPMGAPVAPPPPRPPQRCPKDLHGMVTPDEVGCPPSAATSRSPAEH